MKTLTIVGGSGFIGKSFIEAFNKGLLKNLKIKKLNIICRKPHFLKKIKNLNLKNIKLIKGDIKKIKSLPRCDIVIYSAETTKIKNYKNKKKITKNHKDSINNFCKIIKNKKKTKVLYISSGAIYNYLSNKINKFSNSKYKNIYSKLKIYSENQIKNLGIKTSIARCFSFVGPWLPRTEHYAIGNFINDGLNKKFINVKENDTAMRSYMYSDDLVYWLAKIAINSKIKCPIYNVGSDQSISIKHLAVLIGKIFNKPIKSNKNKIKKTDRYIPNINKAKRELNLRINYNLMKSIILTINNLNEKAN